MYKEFELNVVHTFGKKDILKRKLVFTSMHIVFEWKYKRLGSTQYTLNCIENDIFHNILLFHSNSWIEIKS